MKPLKAANGCLDDLQAAFDYYQAHDPQAAERFLKAYLAGIDLIEKRPRICRIRANGWRQLVIKRYSNYSIFYKEFPEVWLVGGILSTIRDPAFIQANLLIREVREKPDVNE